MSESRSLSLGRTGEAEWQRLSAAYRVSPDKGVMAVFADSPELRNELRRRLVSIGAKLVRLEPGGDLVTRIQALAGSMGSPVAWVEGDGEDGWTEGLIALNRGRDLLWDGGAVVVIVVGPRSLNDRMRTLAPDLSSIVQPVSMIDATPEPLVEPREPICWLHLSDLHVQSERWEQDVVLEALLRDLPGLLERAERRPQFVFVTGDVANRAAWAEYEGAYRLLDRLCEQLGLDPRHRLFMVPGNHDVDRGMISRSVRRFADSFEELEPDEFRTAISELIDDPADFAGFGRRLSAWCQFTTLLLGPAHHVSTDRPWRSDIVEIAGVSVGIASMCSVWMSGPDDAKGRLVVGQRQVQMLIDELRPADMRIALLHHPVGWLRDAEAQQLEDLLRDEFDVVLHGHVHHPRAGSFVQGRRTSVQIGAGALYAGLGQDRYHGFTVAQLDPAREQLDIDAFTFTTRTQHWHIDEGFHREAKRGRLQVPLQLVRLGRASTRVEQTDELADRLRRAAIAVHGSQRFVGLPDGAPKPTATLHDVFVPIELRERGSETQRLELETLTGTLRVADGGSAPRLVVLGDPGSGKTTLCRYLAVSMAEAEDGLCPLLLSVRDWAPGSFELGLLEQARRYAEATLSIRTDVDALERLCEQGRALLLIDGVDEAGTREREALSERVQGFAAMYPRVPIIVTSRIVGYDEAALDKWQFEHLELAPFDDEQLREFVQRWYAVAEPDNPSQRRRREAELWEVLAAEPRAMQLARNPLLATLLAMVHFHRAQLPGDRALLYRLCVETLVVTWPAARGRELLEFEGHEQMPRLEELALWMQSQRPSYLPLQYPEHLRAENQRGIVVTSAQLEKYLLELVTTSFPELEDGRRLALTHKWRRWLVRTSGLLQEHKADRYGFLHLSLMEYLAGQAVWREQVRTGYDAIANFVVEHHHKASWRETLLLMLGSHSGDRSLGDTVIRALLGAKRRTWDTDVFLLALLREELHVDADLRRTVLDAVAQSALDQWPSSWSSAQRPLADILRFGRKHRRGLQEWYTAAMAQYHGKSLVGVLAILPETIVATPMMETRSDNEIGLGALLDLGMSPWGRWAAARAQPNTWLNWATHTPIQGIGWRSFGCLANDWRPGAWVPLVLRRTGWLGRVIRAAAEALRDQPGGGGFGVPSTLTFAIGNSHFQYHVEPRFLIDTTEDDDLRDFGRGFVLDLAVDFALVPALAFPQNFAHVLPPLEFERYFERDIMREFTEKLALDFTRGLAQQSMGIEFPRDFARGHAQSLSEQLSLTRFGSAAQHSTLHAATYDTRDLAVLPYVAEAYTGLLLDPSGQPASHIATARVQNRWLHDDFDDLATQTNRSPEQQALLLALGLAQHQTTHEWPVGSTWHAWFTSPPPEHWLAAYVWHLCWAIGDPENLTHLEAANAALDRNDWPELAAALREYKPVSPLPPEIQALFT